MNNMNGSSLQWNNNELAKLEYNTNYNYNSREYNTYKV